jgi:outer membrane protein assembly factor BamB
VRPIFAVRAGASGDISLAEGESTNGSVVWYQRTGGPYIPSPLLFDGRLYVLYDKGFFAAYDAGSGEEIYRARFGRGGHTFSSSPWLAGGRIFCLDESGLTFVLRPGDSFEIEAENDLDEMSLASPAVAHGSHFIRTASRLYRIGSAPGAPPEESEAP